jgi:hypothetical protein
VQRGVIDYDVGHHTICGEENNLKNTNFTNKNLVDFNNVLEA